VAGSCEFRNETLGSIKWGNFLTSRGTVSFSSRTLLHVVGWLVGWMVGWLVWMVGWLVQLVCLVGLDWVGLVNMPVLDAT